MKSSKSYRIYKAVSNRDYKKLKMLLSRVDSRALNRYTLDVPVLDQAASQGDEVSVELLLAHGAIPDYKRPKHSWACSTLARAIHSGNLKIIQLLINHGCDPDVTLEYKSQRQMKIHTSPYDYWYKMVELNDPPMFQWLLECKGRTIRNDEWSQKLLMTACCLGSNKMVEYFLDQGVSIESVDENGWSSVFFAVIYRRILIFDLLANRGANLNHKDFDGGNLLHTAVFYYPVSYSHGTQPAEISQLLIDRGVDINATNHNGLTPIHFGATLANVNNDVISLLLRQPNIDLTKPDNEGITLLHRLVARGKHYLCKELLFRPDIDINVRDNNNRTPMDFFKIDDYNNKDYLLQTLALMLEFGANTDFLHRIKKEFFKDKDYLKVLEVYKLKRTIAELGNDPNIDALLAKKNLISINDWKDLLSKFIYEIQLMKKTQLCDKMTFHDFFKAKRRTCIQIAKRPEMREIFLDFHGFEFKHYANMLTYTYVSGLRPHSPIESKAIISAEENLDFICNGKLPNLVVYNIKKYLDIEDLVTLENMKF